MVLLDCVLPTQVRLRTTFSRMPSLYGSMIEFCKSPACERSRRSNFQFIEPPLYKEIDAQGLCGHHLQLIFLIASLADQKYPQNKYQLHDFHFLRGVGFHRHPTSFPIMDVPPWLHVHSLHFPESPIPSTRPLIRMSWLLILSSALTPFLQILTYSNNV